MKATLHPDAEEDIAEAAAFYERDGSPALAARFVAEVKRVTISCSPTPHLERPEEAAESCSPPEYSPTRSSTARPKTAYTCWSCAVTGGAQRLVALASRACQAPPATPVEPHKTTHRGRRIGMTRHRSLEDHCEKQFGKASRPVRRHLLHSAGPQDVGFIVFLWIPGYSQPLVGPILWTLDAVVRTIGITKGSPRMPSIKPCEVPPGSLLRKYKDDNGYADCYVTEVAGAVSQAAFIEAFYTSRLFKVERAILKHLASRPSTDADAKQLADGGTERFAAWRVEGRSASELLLTDFTGPTRSWLMASPFDGGADGVGTRR